ncbi:hypothetical protein [Ralstonia pseudosolanacearum]
MSDFKALFDLITRALNSRPFNTLTFRLGAALLLLSNMLIPLGQHRRWMKVEGWWLFPVTAAFAMLGAWLYLVHHLYSWRIAALPYGLLYVCDAMLVVTSPYPPEKESEK